jgi:hypothetical protein
VANGDELLGAAMYSSALRAVDASPLEAARFIEKVSTHTRRVVGGATAAAMGVTTALLGNFASAAHSITTDDKYAARQQLLQKRHARTTRQGLRMGVEALATGLRGAAEGAYRDPLEGARARGLGGFLAGMGRGICGLVTKPLAGGAVALSKATEGITSDVKRAAHTAHDDEHMRMRTPRELGSGGGGPHARVLPYPQPPAAAFAYLGLRAAAPDPSAGPLLTKSAAQPTIERR